eukprot:3518165-Pleurochrysis_carterae.AAC.1
MPACANGRAEHLPRTICVRTYQGRYPSSGEWASAWTGSLIDAEHICQRSIPIWDEHGSSKRASRFASANTRAGSQERKRRRSR